jgi:hypothetical protein
MHGDNDPFTYGDNPAPGFTITAGNLNVTDVIQISAAPHYQGIGIYFNGNSGGTDCIDASSYTGVQFDISGTNMGPGCTIQFSTTDSEHSDSARLNAAGTGPNDPKASGAAGSYSPQLTISQLMSNPTTIQVPFNDSAEASGSPGTPLDSMKIEGVQWQLTTPMASDGGPTECNLNINLANIKFYKD